MLLSADCWRNSPADKEDITSWILTEDHSVKANEQFLGSRCVAKGWGPKFCSKSLTKNGDWLN